MTMPDAYLKESITTASPAQLVLALYDGVLMAVDRAGEDLSGGAPGAMESAHWELVRAQKILTELRAALDHDRGGQISRSLASIYEFCLERLVQANVTKNPSPLGVVSEAIGGLRDAWEQACVTQDGVLVPA